ncbi:MAG: helix-hairpin-helix domain-containing protein [Azoarcus sp.]|jgi:competence protein ComEA|nr:helix-hairpin-helix domain-containing protein [Azoarcus sp.]
MLRFLRFLFMALALSPLAALALEPVNINTADATALQQINGIGPAKASAIIEYRTTNGPFASIDDLVKVPGIGEKSLEHLRSQVTIGNTAAPRSARAGKAGAAPKKD